MDENPKFERVQTKLLPYLRRFINDPEIAEEVLQVAMIRCWQRWRHKPELELEKLIFVVARHHYFKLRRRQRHQRSIVRDESTFTDKDSLETQELRAIVLAALLALPSSQQQVINLHLVDGYTYQEVASLMRQPLSTVKHWGKTALCRLRGILSSYFRN